MNNWRIIGLGSLIVWLACTRPGLALETPGTPATPEAGVQVGPVRPAADTAVNRQSSMGEMREWLNRRNLERKQKGLAVPDTVKNRTAGMDRRWRAEPRNGALGNEAQPGHGMPIQQMGRGSGARIRHRYVINEQGPDQFEIYSGMGYNPLKAESDAQKWARLTPRGRKLWFGGSTLRGTVSQRSRYRAER